MQETLCSEILEFKTWLLENNWPKIVQNIEDKHLGPFKTVELQASATQQVRDVIIANIARENTEMLDKRAADRAVGITTSYRKQPDWNKKQQDCIEIVVGQEQNVIRENALIVLNLSLLYLDFVDAYCARVKKCV